MTETSVTDAIVWPEDYGTGANVSKDMGDFASAAYHGTMALASGHGYAEAGIDLNYNPSDDTLDIGAGLGFVYYDSPNTVQNDTEAYDEQWDHAMVLMVSVPAVSNLQLDAGASNDVYLVVDPTGEDSVRYRYGSSASNPADPDIYLGSVDTATGTVTQANHKPTGTFGDLAAETAVGTWTFSDDVAINGAATVGGNDVLTSAVEGTGNGFNSDLIDGYHHDQFAQNHRTFEITSSNAAVDDRIKIGKISNGGENEMGKFVATLISPVTTTVPYTSSLTMNCGVRNSSDSISHYYYGISAANDTDNVGLVVTETSGTGQNGENEYYLYVDPAVETDSVLIVEHSEFGTFDYTPGLTTADYIGTPIYESITEPPSMDVGFGEVDTERLSGGVTGGADIDDIAGTNLSISGGALEATDTRVSVSDDGSGVVSEVTDINFGADLDATDDGDQTVTVDNSRTTTTTYMSDYTTSAQQAGTDPSDTVFDTAIADTPVDGTLVFDDGTFELANSHAIDKPITVKCEDATIRYTNTANNNAAILFEGGGLTGDSTYIRNNLTPGDRTLLMNGNAIYSAGDTVLLVEGDYASNLNARIQFARIESVSSSTAEITLDGGVHADFEATTTNVYIVDLLDSPRMVDIQTEGGGNRHLQFRWCENPEFRNCKVSEYLEVSLYSLDSWKPRYYNVEARDPMGLASGEGEPVALYRCSDGYVESARVEHCRRGIDFAWGTHNVTVVDPVIRGVSLVGIGIHQNDYGGQFTITGGEVVCDPNGQSGHCIAMSDYSTTYISDMRLVARANAVIGQDETHLSDVAITTVDKSVGGAGLNIQTGDFFAENVTIDDPEGHFQYPVIVDSGGYLAHIDVDVTMTYPGSNAIYIDASPAGTTIQNLKLSGTIRQQGGTQDQTIMLDATAGTISDVDMQMTIYDSSEQALRLYTGTDGTIDGVNIHDSYMQSGLAAIFTDGAGTFGTIRVTDSTFDTGGTSLSFNETVDKLFVTTNDVSGSIDDTGAFTKYVEGNLAG